MIDKTEAAVPSLRASSFQQLFELREEARRKLIEKARQHWSGRFEWGHTDEDAHTEIWYRGVPRKQYQLVPSLLRYSDDPATERDLYAEFVENLVPGKRDWHTLFEMQHNFIPTRLLDWTPSFSVALHFALSSEEALDNPCIWVLHPALLNRAALPKGTAGKLFSRKRFRSLTTDDLKAIPLKYTKDYVEQSLKVPQLPIAITPEAIFPRLHAQRGRFTVQGRKKQPLDILYPEALQRIVISNTAIEEIKESISAAGTDAFSILPDVVGLASFLRQRHDLSEKVKTQTLVHELRDLWNCDIDALKTKKKGAGADVSITGIENCTVSGAYVKRKKGPKGVERRLSDWVWGEKGGIYILTGEAGSGKTNCLVNLVASKKPGEHLLPGKPGRLYEKRTVIWFPLFRFSPKKNLLENLDEYLHSIFDSKSTDLTDALTELLRRSDTILILDGLDELSRTQGEGAAKALVTALKDLPFTEGDDLEDAPKVLISCRRDIFNRLRSHFEPRPEQTGTKAKEPSVETRQSEGQERQFRRDIVLVSKPIEPLSRKEIRNKYGEIGNRKKLLRLLAKYPLFLQLLPKLSKPLRRRKWNPSKPSEFFQSFLAGKKNGKDRNLKALGRVAREMLGERQDFLTKSQFKKVAKECRKEEKVSLKDFFSVALLKERNNDVRFLHHTIREFVLAWNIHHSLTSSKKKGWDMLLETSHLDYEGAEVHRTVAELRPKIRWQKVKKKWNKHKAKSKKRDSWSEKNHFAWCSFETAGMLGHRYCRGAKKGAQRRLLLKWIEDALSGKLDGRKDAYSLRTVYNAARCLERIHCSAPRCYWKWVIRDRKKRREDRESATRKAKGNRKIAGLRMYASAVRGFQLAELKIGKYPYLQMRWKRGDAKPDKKQKQFSRTLVAGIKTLTSYKEISESQLHVLVNMSHALVRWYSPDDKKSVKRILKSVRGKPDMEHVERNLRLTLWYWHPNRKDRLITRKNGVVEASTKKGAKSAKST